MALTYRQKTVLILAFVGILLIAWDIYVFVGNDEEGDTISAVIHDLGTRSWFLLFSAGVLAGHFWWPQYVERKTKEDDDPHS